MRYPKYIIPSKKLDNKKLFPLVAKAREDYNNTEARNNDYKTRFVTFLHETQKLTFIEMEKLGVFGLKKSQLNNIYLSSKGGRS